MCRYFVYFLISWMYSYSRELWEYVSCVRSFKEPFYGCVDHRYSFATKREDINISLWSIIQAVSFHCFKIKGIGGGGPKKKKRNLLTVCVTFRINEIMSIVYVVHAYVFCGTLQSFALNESHLRKQYKKHSREVCGYYTPVLSSSGNQTKIAVFKLLFWLYKLCCVCNFAVGLEVCQF